MRKASERSPGGFPASAAAEPRRGRGHASERLQASPRMQAQRQQLAVMQRQIPGLEAYAEPDAIPPDWVADFIADHHDPQSHLNRDDIDLIYRAMGGGDWPADVERVNAGAHWDLRVGKGDDAFLIETFHDGSCAVHVAHALLALRAGEIRGAQKDWRAPADFVAAARSRLREQYAGEVKPELIKVMIADVIKTKDNLPETGFGAKLRARIEATGLIDTGVEAAALEGFARRAAAGGLARASSLPDRPERPDAEQRRDAMRAYLNRLRERLPKAEGDQELKALGAELAIGFRLINDEQTAALVSAEFGKPSRASLQRLQRQHPQLQLAAVLTHVLERVFNEQQRAKSTFTSARQVAAEYAAELSQAFSLAKDPAQAPEGIAGPRGRPQLPPKTVSGVLARGAEGAVPSIYLGHNAKGAAGELKARRELIKGTEAADNLASVETSVRGGSLTDDDRDPLNCAECVPISTARRARLQIGTDDVFPLSIHEGSQYLGIATCANCQSMYGIEDRAERARKQEAAKRKEEQEAAEAARRQQSRAAKSEAKDQRTTMRSDEASFKADVKRLYGLLKKDVKGVAENQVHEQLPYAKYADRWAGLSEADKSAEVRAAMTRVKVKKR